MCSGSEQIEQQAELITKEDLQLQRAVLFNAVGGLYCNWDASGPLEGLARCARPLHQDIPLCPFHDVHADYKAGLGRGRSER